MAISEPPDSGAINVQLIGASGALFVDVVDWNPVTLWDVGASVLAPIFAGGRLTANLDAATAQRDQAALRVLPHPRVREGEGKALILP